MSSMANTEPATGRALTFDDLLTMSGQQLHAIIDAAHPLDPDAIAGKQFIGADLSLPRIGQKILWQNFRKTFVRDEARGEIRGWNVRMEQHGIRGPQIPLRRRNGSEKSFAHYRLRPAAGIRWPRGWHGAHYLDYSVAGNRPPECLMWTPLVAVNEGSSDLLLGWEVFRVAGRFIAPSLYWALQADGPVEQIVDPPRTPRG